MLAGDSRGRPALQQIPTSFPGGRNHSHYSGAVVHNRKLVLSTFCCSKTVDDVFFLWGRNSMPISQSLYTTDSTIEYISFGLIDSVVAPIALHSGSGPLSVGGVPGLKNIRNCLVGW